MTHKRIQRYQHDRATHMLRSCSAEQMSEEEKIGLLAAADPDEDQHHVSATLGLDALQLAEKQDLLTKQRELDELASANDGSMGMKSPGDEMGTQLTPSGRVKTANGGYFEKTAISPVTGVAVAVEDMEGMKNLRDGQDKPCPPLTDSLMPYRFSESQEEDTHMVQTHRLLCDKQCEYVTVTSSSLRKSSRQGRVR